MNLERFVLIVLYKENGKSYILASPHYHIMIDSTSLAAMPHEYKSNQKWVGQLEVIIAAHDTPTTANARKGDLRSK